MKRFFAFFIPLVISVAIVGYGYYYSKIFEDATFRLFGDKEPRIEVNLDVEEGVTPIEKEAFDAFSHKFLEASLTAVRHINNYAYNFVLKRNAMTHSSIALPDGGYTVTGSSKDPSDNRATDGMRFKIHDNYFFSTDTLISKFHLEPESSLLVVKGDNTKATFSYRDNYGKLCTQGFFVDKSGIKYIYFTPSKDAVVSITSDNNKTVSMKVEDLTIGKIYYVTAEKFTTKEYDLAPSIAAAPAITF